LELAIILGTRPEIIKLSPVIRECSRLKIECFVVHTGQHYSYNMDRVFFDQLGLPEPEYNLGVGCGSHAEQTGRMLIAIEGILKKESPTLVLVQGDTNTTLAGALAAVKLGIRVGHVEAGLRSYDRGMPEEINRVLTDHCSDLLFAPTEGSREILLGEGIPRQKIFVTGNTIVDAVHQNLSLARRQNKIHSKLGLRPDNYFVVTVHRQENVDNKSRFRNIIRGLEAVYQQFGFPLVYPIHPRAKMRIKEFGLRVGKITLIEPLDYLSFLNLESKARLILTDSGGVQEEACILGVPCVTLRHSTERPETLSVGANMLAGTDPNSIVRSVQVMMKKNRNWDNPFGDGNAGRRIMGIVVSQEEG